MASKSTKTARPSYASTDERTSASVASVAGQILNGRRLNDSVAWLQSVVDSPKTLESAREHAFVLLSAVDAMRRVAASALTQRKR